jgi:copper chaperone
MCALQETMMIEIKVPDMTCGHCASTITKAVKELDPAAKLDISLSEHLVKVDSGAARNDILHAISEAGYTPEAA